MGRGDREETGDAVDVGDGVTSSSCDEFFRDEATFGAGRLLRSASFLLFVAVSSLLLIVV